MPVFEVWGPLRGALPSATLAINERSAALAAQGREVFRLGLGQSPFPVPDYAVEALRAHAGEKDYLPVRGLARLREAVAAYHRDRGDCDRGADSVVIGPGSKELMFLLQLAFDGELLLPSPSWVSYEPQARLAGRPVRWIDTELAAGWRLSPERLDAACAGAEKPRLLILNAPSNPTGASHDAAALEALAEVARARGVVILSDEIYGELHHRGEHVSIARFYPEGTIVSGGLSKWFGAGGWRLGTFSFPPELAPLADAVAVAASETFTSVSAPIQHAAVCAFADRPERRAYLARSRRIVAALGAWASGRLRDAGLACAAPDGGFYLFPVAAPGFLAARGLSTSAALCERLLEDTGVAVLPGTDFGRPPEEASLRLAYVDFDGATALARVDEHADLDETALRSLAPRVCEAIDRLAGWFSQA